MDHSRSLALVKKRPARPFQLRQQVPVQPVVTRPHYGQVERAVDRRAQELEEGRLLEARVDQARHLCYAVGVDEQRVQIFFERYKKFCDSRLILAIEV